MSRKHSGRVAVAHIQQAHAPVFAALGDQTRLAVEKLCGGQPHSISQLTSGTRLTRQAITKHLRVLEHAGIVHSFRAGRESLFKFDPQPIENGSEAWDLIQGMARRFSSSQETMSPSR